MFYQFKNFTETSKDLYIYGDIVSEKEPDWWTGYVSETDIDLKEFREAVEDLQSGQILNIYVNSGGGSVFAASAMISMLKRAQERGVKVITYIDGLAGSAASLFPMAADETHLYANSMLMIHKPLAGFRGYFNADELQKSIDELNSIEDAVLLPLYVANSQLTTEQFKELLSAETWMNAQQMINTFDSFILHDEEKSVAACVSDCFKMYNRTPAEYIKTPAAAIPAAKPVENFDYSEFENKLNSISERK